MVGKTLVTKQSGETGFPCNSVYVVEKLDIAKEMYVAITIDRNAGAPVIVYSPAGGMNIEDVAAKDPT
jgi:succinyl-CoA synthetase beta subunit